MNREMKIRCRIANKIISDASKSNWNTWREHYDNLSINDLIWINLAINEFTRDQICVTDHLIENAMNILITKVDSLNVIELGCYRGYLAKSILKSFGDNIERWTGYDINYYALENTVVDDKKYSTIKQTDWFYNIKIDKAYNVFVSTSTLEHHNGDQFKKIIERVSESNINHMILGFPLRDARKWHNYDGSHILEFYKDDVIKTLEDQDFKCINYEKGKVHTWLMERI